MTKLYDTSKLLRQHWPHIYDLNSGVKFISSEHLLDRTLHKTFHNGIENMFTD